ncbi:mitochondrial distribution and morphology protein 10 [Kwoniella mangroviensis CBS 8886]|nr:mitochondrial distribution and morphology protein 10 [Kwoniella mangroviensis CBS 8886]
MIGFSNFILRNYYNAIGWNEDNLYSSITRSSSSLLDFQVPQSLILQLANAPTPIFFNSYALDALPQLNGSIQYITTSEPLEQIGASRSIRFKDVVERFQVFPPPKRPLVKDEVWLAGKRIEGRDYLLYSRLHLPSLHLSGLATTRLTPTLQAHLAFLSQPASPAATRPASPNTPPSHSRNILLSLQHDTGRYSGEYTYSAQDGMFGIRGLYNFGWQSADIRNLIYNQSTPSGGVITVVKKETEQDGKRIDEEEMMEGGLKGRFSAGGEVYFSAKQRSFGISSGLRFTTLPQSPNGPPASPPTTLTLLYNPLIGFLSSAYSAQVSPTVALSTRFGVNVYSYESDLAIGGEWWIGRRRGKRDITQQSSASSPFRSKSIGQDGELDGEVPTKAAEERISQFESWREASLRPAEQTVETIQDGPLNVTDIKTRAGTEQTDVPNSDEVEAIDDRDGVLKARLSGNWSIALLYEARIRKCLVSVGIVSDLASRQRPIRSVGVEVQYFS